MKSKKEIEAIKEAAAHLMKCAEVLNKMAAEDRDENANSGEQKRRICD